MKMRFPEIIFFKPTIMLLALCVACLFASASHSTENDSGLINILPNAKLPSFKLSDFQTKSQFAVETSSGKPTLITFFSLTPPYRLNRSLNLLEIQAKINKHFGDKINSVALLSDEQKISSIQQYIDDGLIAVTVLDDSKRVIYNKYGIYMMPISVLISPTGNLHAVIPYTGELQELLTSNIKFLLGDFSKEQLKKSLEPKANLVRSAEEKEYIRRVNYGRVMLAKKMLPAAIREFSTATKIMPDSIEAIIGLGDVQLQAKKYEHAESSFKQALTIDKDSDKALAGLGISLYRQGRITEALPVLENALIAENPSFEVIVTLAEMYEQAGDVIKSMRLNKLAVSRLIKRFD
nr:redoxin domain-containing protein [Desulfobulbaceae bacterium]